MKSKFVKFIYRIIEILPHRIAEKIKIIGCVIFGDWYFIMPRYPFFKEFPILNYEYHVKCLSLNCCSVKLTLIAIPQLRVFL